MVAGVYYLSQTFNHEGEGEGLPETADVNRESVELQVNQGTH